MTNQKQTVKFGDICREVKITSKNPLAEGYDKYIGLEHLDSGSLKIKRWGRIAEDKPSFTRVFKKGHILFGKRRSYLKKAAIAEFDGICSGDIIVMEPKGDLMLPELLPLIVQSERFWDWAIKTSAGGLSPRTKFSSLQECQITLPILSRQQRLVEIFDKILTVINMNEKVIHDLKRVKDSLELKFLKFERIKDKNKLCVLKDVSKNITDGVHQTVPKLSDGAIPFAFVSSIVNGKLDYESGSFISEKVYEKISKGKKIQSGDLLYTVVGSYGEVALIESDRRVGFERNIALIRLNQHLVYSKYLLAWLSSKYFKHYVETIATGNAQKLISLSDVNRFPIKKIDIKEQKTIGLLFQSIRSENDLFESKLLDARQILRSIATQEFQEG
ncbi:restriction endonuclease subunit S [Methylobacter svalbardensis]|uniref:restriction endonuclease subunit S n=1 Tax=Methylobacter svalbardensis TaxID=3080016 RepID=UPI0030EE05EA